MEKNRARGLTAMGMLCLLLSVQSQGQTVRIQPSSIVNKRYVHSPTPHNPNINYYSYDNLTIFINSAGIGTPVEFEDLGIQHFGYATTCPQGNAREVYNPNGTGNQDYFTLSPTTSNLGQAIKVDMVMTGSGYACGHHTGIYDDEPVSSFYIFVEQPMFINSSNILNICQGGPIIQLSDYFQGATPVKWYLDDPIGSTPITTLNPAKIQAGQHNIFAYKKYDNGIYSDHIPIIIIPSTPITFGTYPAAVCANSDVVNIQAFPKGGTWSGQGVDNNGNFDPSKVGIGAADLTYSYVDPSKNTNPAGCKSSKTLTITVKAPPIVSAGQQIVVCQNSAPVVMTDGTPAGGTWAGQGVVGNMFSPSAVTPGIYEIAYTVTDQNNGCSSSANKSITVKALPVVIAGLDKAVCSSTPAFDLSADATPVGGTFSGTGVVSNSFDPSISGAGSFKVTYSYTNPATNCISTSSRQITVKQAPIPVAPANKTVCQNAPPFALQGASPTGGTYSGVGVVQNVFSPAVAGPGNSVITYTYTDPTTGCNGTTSFIISVNPLPAVSAGLPITVCYNSGKQALTGSPSGGNWSGTGISGNTFDPQIAGTGTHNLTYAYTDPGTGCTASSIIVATVKPVPVIKVPADTAVCVNSPLVKLNGLPAGGMWTGTGVVNNSLDPLKAGTGTFVLTYTYQDQVTGCASSANFSVTVKDVPKPNPPASFNICLNAAPVLLQGATPVGGVYTGDGVDGGVFNAAKAGPGNHTITYAFKDPNVGCTGYTSFIILVKPLPAVYAGNSFRVCVNGAAMALSGQPAGGTWSGSGVTGNTFSPSKSGPGRYILAYTYTDASSGCAATDTISALVYPLPQFNLGSDTTLCQNSGILTLKAFPQGGKWSGPGVFENNFDPRQAQISANTLTYTFTNANGCQSSASRLITVVPYTAVSVGNPVTLCINSAPFDLKADASIQGGVWSGKAVNGGFFSPGVAGVGTYSVVYTFQNASGCTTVSSRQITVLGVPGKVNISGNAQGCDGSTLTLFAQGDSASDYQWYHVNDIAPFARGATLNYSIHGNETLYCVGVNQLSCGLAKLVSSSVNIVSKSPGADLISSQTATPFGGLVQFTASNNYNVANYRWKFGDGGSSTEKNPSHYYYQKGVFKVSVVLTSPEGCSDSVTLRNTISVGSDDSLHVDPGQPRASGIDDSPYLTKAFPSPFTDHVFITCHLGRPQPVSMLLYDTYGRLLLSQSFSGEKGDNRFRLSGLDRLIIKNYYLVILKSAELDEVIKILKM